MRKMLKKFGNIGWEMTLYKMEALYAKVIMLQFSRASTHYVENKLERRGDTHPLRAQSYATDRQSRCSLLAIQFDILP